VFFDKDDIMQTLKKLEETKHVFYGIFGCHSNVGEVAKSSEMLRRVDW
jgi:hypothetical protein